MQEIQYPALQGSQNYISYSSEGFTERNYQNKEKVEVGSTEGQEKNCLNLASVAMCMNQIVQKKLNENLSCSLKNTSQSCYLQEKKIRTHFSNPHKGLILVHSNKLVQTILNVP